MVSRDFAGLAVTCSNHKALEVLDRLLVAAVSFREFPLPLARRAVELDPSLVLAHCLLGYLQLSHFHRANSPRVSVHIRAVREAEERGELTERERRHVQALLAFSEGDLPRATHHWAHILIHHPRDLLAVHMHFVSCKMLGEFERGRDVLAAVLPHWETTSSIYPYLLALYAFGLEETNYHSRAEQLAREALSIEPKTPFACHVMAHVLEETKPAADGVQFLSGSRGNWNDTTYNNHLTWHLALYQLELGDTASVLREYDTILVKAATSENRLGMLDASSLLWRLSLMGVDTGNRWQQVTDAFKDHIGKHGSSWYDAHLMFSLCHGKLCEETARLALAREMMKSMEEYGKNGNCYDSSITDKLGVPCCNALLAYGEERYDDVVTLLVPLRYDLWKLGGSWAQRQVFSLTVIQAAVNARDIPMAMALISELKAQKPHAHTLTLMFDSLKATYDAQQDEKTTPTPSAEQAKKTTPTPPTLDPPDCKRPRNED